MIDKKQKQRVETQPRASSSRIVLTFLLCPLSLFPLFALMTYDWHAIESLCSPAQASTNWIGPLGDWFAHVGYQIFGLAIWLVPIFCFGLWVRALMGGERLPLGRLLLKIFLCLFTFACLLQVMQPHAPGVRWMVNTANISDAGGGIGHFIITLFLSGLISDFGAGIIAGCAFLASLISLIGIQTIFRVCKAIYRWAIPAREKAEEEGDEESLGLSREEEIAAIRRNQEEMKRTREEAKRRLQEERLRAARAEATPVEPAPATQSILSRVKPQEAQPKPVAKKAPASAPAPAAPVAKDEPYSLPPVDLLDPLKVNAADHGDVEATSQRLLDTLALFNIKGQLSYTVRGPVVTQYAVLLEPGTRYSAVESLQANIKGALHAKSLRIEAPIEGEEAVGFEVPNEKPIGVSFREIFESEAWQTAKDKYEVPLLFGREASGRELVADLATMPHMLVAGATGQGKSVCLNSLICGLLMSRTPEQVKFIMVDPKSVEFTPYASLPHLLVPVIIDNMKVVKSLGWAVMEMEKRLRLFASVGVKNIKSFNSRAILSQPDMFGNGEEVKTAVPRTLPYIIIFIDEVADLMQTCGKEVTPHISRLAAKARAAGIHLILATQRPDAKIITGSIKANIPTRVAFKTSQAIDSRTILDESGAEELIGRGDMLFKGKEGKPRRAQGCWISDDEIDRITTYISEHSSLQYDEEFATKLSRVKEAQVEDPFASEEEEERPSRAEEREAIRANENASLFQKAIEVIIETKRASISHFQRRLKIGYNHAARLCDELEEKGIVGPQSGAGPRSIIFNEDELRALLEEDTQAEPQEPDESISDSEAMPDESVALDGVADNDEGPTEEDLAAADQLFDDTEEK